MATAPTVRLADYQPPPYRIERIDLEFVLEESVARVTARSRWRRAAAAAGQALALHRGDFVLESLAIDGRVLGSGDYALGDERLVLSAPPEVFKLCAVTRINAAANTSLMGLYLSRGNYFTQCEAEGFRKITPMLDRPDVTAVYSTTNCGSAELFPVMLSNGNLVEETMLPDGRKRVRWEDPFPKPSYLFALVAGRFARLQDRHVTPSGRSVLLEMYAAAEDIDKCRHALASLKRAMRWDEETYLLEYDLDRYMIVAAADFNMGAMENKGLNVFNTKYVLANADIATDRDYLDVEGVIGHEYFHNWTGNRVTCRDWFQLSLKEGLTVFRDQEFSADMGARAVKRIDDVRALRAHQFPEDAGPTAHSVQPSSYIEISNFYTATVYNKGAEVVRMIQTLTGKAGFRAGLRLYLQRHDGAAVTIDEFLAAMADANGIDLSQFRLWYTQTGTPRLRARWKHDTATRVFELEVTQDCPPTPGQAHKKPFHLPLAIGLVGADGSDLALALEGEPAASGTTRVLHLREERQSFRFTGIDQVPVPSLLRGFSAPVILDAELSDDDLCFLLAHDSDDFNRWEAAQQLALRALLRLTADADAALPNGLLPAFESALNDDRLHVARAGPATAGRCLRRGADGTGRPGRGGTRAAAACRRSVPGHARTAASPASAVG